MREEAGDFRGVLELIAERKIEEAMREGAFDDLPGKGKPLPLQEEWFVPPEWRPAIRLLKSAEVLPEWLQKAKELEAARRQCRQLFQKAQSEYPRYAQSAPEQFRSWYRTTFTAYCEALQRVNQLVLHFNVLAPTAQRVETPYRLEEEIARFQRLLPCPEGLTLETEQLPKSERQSSIRPLLQYEYQIDRERRSQTQAASSPGQLTLSRRVIE